MAKLEGPLLSVSAHGSIHKELTYSKRKSGNQVRYQRKQLVLSSEELLNARDKFFVAAIVWGILNTLEQAYWDFLAAHGWVEILYPDAYVGSADGHTLGKIQRNRYLPEILINKGVPKTNQSVVYYQGDDGTYQAGVEAQIERFVSNNNGTVTDLATDLMWVADPSELGGIWGTPGNPAAMSWYDAVDACNNLNYAGYSDWRIPNTKELESLIQYDKINPSIDKDKFPNTKGGEYSSGTITNYGCENYYIPDFINGKKAWDQDKTKKKYVRPVRNIPKGHRMKSKRRAK